MFPVSQLSTQHDPCRPPRRADSTVLVVEDDPEIAHLISLDLANEGHAAEIARDGAAALERVRHKDYALMLLDLMLPGVDGLGVCREVRAMDRYLPIIILSARSSETHRVIGLELGADDYLAKPFSFPELNARVRSVLRRMDAAAQRAASMLGTIQAGELTIDPLAREVRLDGAAVNMTAREFDLLLFFARHPDRVFSRMELLDHVWGHAHDGYEHTVNSHINRLRAKVEREPARPRHIQTVWGVGYRFNRSAGA
ncbi:MAG: response regulator transcription factor [Gammaproteobacteria bacterium]|jgi:two-component system, OmpR family, response regulator|nr:response regulator transcription factor [Gammaproteobacteria bacterium]MBU0773431.1 response regulator transcription factor [Gammaproteobacteria bacterium]MBU0856642.1 response regulator transcription factor [Gammaproteobacteria bacterium]MBU1846828.1 response regulator transcription factor [Gammaproteobacteria bacterium]